MVDNLDNFIDASTFAVRNHQSIGKTFLKLREFLLVKLVNFGKYGKY